MRMSRLGYAVNSAVPICGSFPQRPSQPSDIGTPQEKERVTKFWIAYNREHHIKGR